MGNMYVCLRYGKMCIKTWLIFLIVLLLLLLLLFSFKPLETTVVYYEYIFTMVELLQHNYKLKYVFIA